MQSSMAVIMSVFRRRDPGNVFVATLIRCAPQPLRSRVGH